MKLLSRIKQELDKVYIYRTKGKMRRSLSMLLASIVVFVTVYQMILPALTLEIDEAQQTPGIYLENDDLFEETYSEDISELKEEQGDDQAEFIDDATTPLGSDGEILLEGENSEYTYEDTELTAECGSDTIRLSYDSAARIPDGSVLTATKLWGEEAAPLAASAEQAISEIYPNRVLQQTALYKLSITGPEGETIYPTGQISVTILFGEIIPTDTPIAASYGVDNVAVLSETDMIEEADGGVSRITFTCDRFEAVGMAATAAKEEQEVEAAVELKQEVELAAETEQGVEVAAEENVENILHDPTQTNQEADEIAALVENAMGGAAQSEQEADTASEYVERISDDTGSDSVSTDIENKTDNNEDNGTTSAEEFAAADTDTETDADADAETEFEETTEEELDEPAKEEPGETAEEEADETAEDESDETVEDESDETTEDESEEISEAESEENAEEGEDAEEDSATENAASPIPASGTTKPAATGTIVRPAASADFILDVPGQPYSLHISYDKAAGIPEGAEFVATPLEDENYASQALELVNNETLTGRANLIGLFDLTVYLDGKVIAPTGPVKIEAVFEYSLEGNEEIYAVHFPGTGEQPQPEETYEEAEENVDESSDEFTDVALTGTTVEEAEEIIEEVSGGLEIAATGSVFDEGLETIENLAIDSASADLGEAEFFTYENVPSDSESASESTPAEVVEETFEAAEEIVEASEEAVEASFEEVSEEAVEAASETAAEEMPPADLVEEIDYTPEVLPVEVDGNSAAFETESFSYFAIVGTKIEMNILASDGHNYRITAVYGPETGIPMDAKLVVEEITDTSSVYDGYVSKTENALEMKEGSSEYVRLFDISITDRDGKKIQPAAGSVVNIHMELADVTNEEINVVHFADENDSGSVMDTEVDRQTVTFEADGFSVFAVAYTVDFEYFVNGKMYRYILPGGGFVSFTDLIELLGIIGPTENEDSEDEDHATLTEKEKETIIDELTPGDVEVSEAVRKFVADVASVEFSSPELVDVSKVEYETTVGEIKESRGLECEYSAELTEAQIEEINAQTVKAGDWALISMLPFQSEETLTVTMKNGEVFTIRVTDAQIRKTVLDAKGDAWEIIVTYGPEAGIPDGTELRVTEYSKNDLLFDECFSDREKWVSAIADSSENNSLKETVSERTDSPIFEQGFGDAVSYDISGDLSDEEKAHAMSVVQFSGIPVISGYILFDISLIYNENEIEPQAPVQVTIKSANPELQEYDDISVGHFVEDTDNTSDELSMETIDVSSSGSDESKENALITVDFEATSFSLYDVTGIQWTANTSKTVYFALKTGINKVLNTDQNGTIPVVYSEIENMDPSQVGAYIRSLPGYANAEPIIIYDKSGTDFYAIDGNGNLVQVYESGDTVMWTGRPSIGWKLVRYMNESGEYTGYYDFINMETGKFLTPQSTQTISDNRIGIQLDGAAGHNSTIKAWDDAVNAYCGYSIQNNRLVTSESIEWFFASVSQTVSDDLKLQTVETVDSTSLGITIKMFDYPNATSKNNRAQYQTDFKIYDRSGSDWLNGGPVIQGLVKNTLNSDGFPVATYNNTNLNGLFTGSNNVTATNANHLFIKQTYDETGYFEYSSFENYAYLGSGTDFTVYRQIGVEDIAYTPGEKTYGKSTDYYFNRGNFLPYNSIQDYKTAAQKYGSAGVTNKYDEDGNRLSSEDPRNGEHLFLTQESVDYFFGMSMEAHFYQPVDGKNNGEDVIYEFNGDDDLWIFIDNVLVLDIGGCHHAHSGFINFSTGRVQVNTGNGLATTTIKQCFKNAKIFPDGTPWVENKANLYFSGDTFADYSQHNMKMFYMERGAGASNLHIKFNLPVIKDAGKLIVDKVVSGTQNAKYSNEKFPFQVIKVDGDTETRFTSAVYESNGQPVEYKHEVVIDGITYNDVFYLRSGEAAVFDVTDNSQQYYVKELGIDTRYYDRVLINREQSDITDGIAESSVNSVKNRNRVTYDNHGVTENLRIKKIVEGDVKNSEDKFEFYVYLTGPNNELIPYSNGDYYVLDPNGYYCTYVNGLPVGDSSITEATRTAYHSGQWGTIGSIPDGYTVLIPDLFVSTDFMVSERIDNLPEGYAFKNIEVKTGTADTVNIGNYTNVTQGDAGTITIGGNSFSNHCEGKLKTDPNMDATAMVTNLVEKKLNINKVWNTNNYVTVHGPVQFALYKLVNGTEVLVENSVKTLTAPDLSVEYRIAGNLAEYVVREVVVTTDGNEKTVSPIADNGKIKVSGETTKIGRDKTDTYIVTYQKGKGTETSRTDTVTNKMPELAVNKKDITNNNQLADAEFKLTGEDGKTALPGYESLKSDKKTSGNLLNGICLSDGTYYLVETKAPTGFNALEYKVKIVVDGDKTKIFTAFTGQESTKPIDDQTPNNNMVYTFNVYNNPGVELPSTGGSGTTLYYLLGSILLLMAAAMLTLKGARRVLG